MLLLAFSLAYAGLAALSLAMERHHRDLFGRAPGRRARPVLRGGGWLLLLAAIWPCVAAAQVSIGIILWLGLASAAALLLAGLLAWVPAAAIPAAILLPLLGGLAAGSGPA